MNRHCGTPWRFTPRRILCSLCLYSSALAAAEGLQPGQESLRLQQQQQRELQRLQLEQRRRQLQRGGAQAPASAPALPGQAAQDEYCWPLQGLRLAGVTLLPASALEAGIKAHMAPCMGVHQINRLLAEITRVYVAAGFIAVRPYLRHMPAAGRTLDITVDEGYVEAIELADQRLPLSLRGAFPGMLGAPLNLRDLEQGLDQLNRLRSVDMTADIVPGSRQGASRIILRAAASAAHWSLDLGLDNTGNASTGPERQTLGLTLDSPLQLNDALSLSASNTLNHGPRLSSSTGLFYSVPYGYWTLSAFASHIEYRAPLKLTTTTLYGSGRTDQFGLRVDRVLWRNQGHQLSAHLQLAHKDVDAYLQKARLGIQSPTLTLAEAGFNLFWHDAAVWSLDLNYTRGLTWLGADRDSDRVLPNLPRAQSQTYRASLVQWRSSQLGGQPLQWQSQLSLQYSPDPLPAIEQLLGTDDSAVRGYRRNSASGAIGALWRNTLYMPVRSNRAVTLTARLGLDHGWVKPEHGVPGLYLSGASVGLNLSWHRLQLDLDYQHALNLAKGFSHEPPVWLARLSVQI